MEINTFIHSYSCFPGMINCRLRYFLPFFILFLAANLRAQSVINEVMDGPPGFPEHVMKQMPPMGKYLGPGLFAHTQPLFETYSAAEKIFAGTTEGKLYVRKADSEEIRILAEPNTGWYWSIEGSVISPNGKYIAVKQIDDREVPRIKYAGKSPDELFYKPYSKAGEPLPKQQFYIVDIRTGTTTIIEHGLAHPYIHVTGWSSDNNYVRLLRADRLLKKLDLLETDPGTGKISTLLTEQSKSYLVGLNLLQGYSNRLIDMNLAWFLDKKQQFIWTSSRSGFEQLYLYGKGGVLIRPLTNKFKNGIVSGLIEVDDKNGWAYFYARADEKHLYNLQLFRTSLNENKIEKLLDGPNFLELLFSKAKDSFWILRTQLPNLMQIDAYSSSGEHLNLVWEANLKPVKESGLDPEYVPALAADNKTSLEAFILKPKEFDAGQKYPVIEYIYGGPNTTVIPRDIFDRSMWNMQHLANNGFIVVMIDGRGTPLRGNYFLNYNYGKFGQVEIKDHISVIKQLGKQRPYMDLKKVGIIGHSWGGYFALKALIDEPEFYKAGHINASAVDPINFRIAIEPFMGCLPIDCPEKYESSAITNKLNKLKAPILISHGTADDDVLIEESYNLIKALKAIGNKNYEFVEYPGMDHIIMRNKNWEPAMIDFFVKQLKGNN